MTNLITFDGFQDSEIRVTEDGRYSVYDVIKFCGCTGERKVWERLVERFPEVVTFCHKYKFPGKGQRETPVASREGILQIIGQSKALSPCPPRVFVFQGVSAYLASKTFGKCVDNFLGVRLY